MRMTSLTIALLTPLALLAACGDGIDERYDAQGELVEGDVEPVAESTTTTTEVRELDDVSVDHPGTEFEESDALYSGATSAVRVGDTWVVSGFDNQSDFQQPERGAIWTSDDLITFQRSGLDISDGPDQQSISQLLVAGDWLLAVGGDFSRTGVESGISDAVVWRSDDVGDSFDRVVIERNARISSAVVIDDVIWAAGAMDVDGEFAGQLWRSDDDGRTWTATDPQATPSPGAPLLRLGPLEAVLEWNGSLIAVGSTTATDPQGGNYLLPTEVFSANIPESSIPVDIGVWYSDDDGAHWSSTRPSGLAGELGTGRPSEALVVGDHLLIVGVTSRGFDPTTFDPSSDSFVDIGKSVAHAWWCDYTLQRCEDIVLLPDPLDFADVTVKDLGDGLVAFAVRGLDFTGDDQIARVGVLDPASGETTWVGGNGRLEQVEAIEIVDGTIYWFGRDPESNLLHVATSELPR